MTLDSLGESVTSEAEAHRAAEVYHQLLDCDCRAQAECQHQREADADGAGASRPSWRRALPRAWPSTPQRGSFVRIDMEDSSLTQVTLDIVRRLHARPELRGAIGIVIQAYLYRSQADIEQLIGRGHPGAAVQGRVQGAGGGGFSAQGGRGRELRATGRRCCSTAPSIMAWPPTTRP